MEIEISRQKFIIFRKKSQISRDTPHESRLYLQKHNIVFFAQKPVKKRFYDQKYQKV